MGDLPSEVKEWVYGLSGLQGELKMLRAIAMAMKNEWPGLERLLPPAWPPHMLCQKALIAEGPCR